MTKRMLAINVALVCLGLATLLGLAQISSGLYQTVKDFTGIFVAIAAAYLAYCFQRRQTFLASLRELWSKCIEAKADLIEYTHEPAPDRLKFGKVHRTLSTAIDMMRAVYCNVGETEASVGRYPFEPLHDMRRALDELGFEAADAAEQRKTRQRIMAAWNAFRWSFLREFSIPKPTHYIASRDAADPRR
jgi:hypothetical protein